MPNRTQRVLIAGGGHAGVRAAQRLLDGRRPADRLEVAMASPENVELWHGLMPQVLSGTLQPQHVMVPLREVVPGLALYNYEVRELDLDKGRRCSRGEWRAMRFISTSTIWASPSVRS